MFRGRVLRSKLDLTRQVFELLLIIKRFVHLLVAGLFNRSGIDKTIELSIQESNCNLRKPISCCQNIKSDLAI